MKKMIALLTAAILVLAVSISAAADAPILEDVKYEGFGYVDVDFHGDVQYSDVKVSVTAEDGTPHDAEIWKLDEDDLTFNAANLEEGSLYSFTITGVRSLRGGEYSSVSGSFRVPSGDEMYIKEVDYDSREGDLEIEFRGRVRFQEPTVTVEDASGATYEARIIERDDDGIEAIVRGLEGGVEYSVVVTGVQASGADAFGTARAMFMVY